MGCCNRGDQYRCSRCGAAMAVTAAPQDRNQHSEETAHCFHCGAPMQAESQGANAGRSKPEKQQGAEEDQRRGCC